jgi:endogenous inhibitor of DNA gyrase (YacG/DUF329 family)
MSIEYDNTPRKCPTCGAPVFKKSVFIPTWQGHDITRPQGYVCALQCGWSSPD